MTKTGDYVNSWLDQGCEDIRSAIALYEVSAWSNACVLAQQAAEKIMKGVLLQAGHALVFTHDLAKLNVKLAEEHLVESVDEHKRAAVELNKAFWMGRYPQAELETAPVNMFSENDACCAINHAFSFFDMATLYLKDWNEPFCQMAEKLRMEWMRKSA